MNKFKDFATNLEKILDKEDIKIDEPMKEHTSFRVGGPVDILVTPKKFQEVVDVITLCKEHNIPYYIMGNGSNLLVKDGGIRGIMIKLIKLNEVKVEDNKIITESGVSLKDISTTALNNKLSGFEFACGIPGSVGGAVTMNAGAYNGEISHVVESAKVIDNEGKIKVLDRKQLELEYRSSSILKYKYTVLEVTFNLEHGDYEKIKKPCRRFE
jgi:UDP-N-acetylmuramate dehydrogenase